SARTPGSRTRHGPRINLNLNVNLNLNLVSFTSFTSFTSMIPPEIIEQVRDAADLVTLIGEHVELKRTGSDWRGPCPFHGGTHRNFSVVPKKQMYHCFVCHESGDIFTFFMKRFGLDYPSAVKEIAGRVGVTVPESQKLGPD